MLVAATVEDSSCDALRSAGEAIAALIAEFCPIARKVVKLSKRSQADNMMRVAGLVAIGAIPDCHELFQFAETVARLQVENGCSVARPAMKKATKRAVKK